MLSYCAHWLISSIGWWKHTISIDCCPVCIHPNDWNEEQIYYELKWSVAEMLKTNVSSWLLTKSNCNWDVWNETLTKSNCKFVFISMTVILVKAHIYSWLQTKSDQSKANPGDLEYRTKLTGEGKIIIEIKKVVNPSLLSGVLRQI